MGRLLPTRWSGPAIRWFKALTTQGSYVLSKRRPARVKRIRRAATKLQLPKGYDIDTHITPRYDPWDQRLCVVPNGDLVKAIGGIEVSVDGEVVDLPDRLTYKGMMLEGIPNLARFLKAGSAFPWQVHQSYLRDHRALKRSALADEAMTFSNPVPELRSAPVAEPVPA